MTDFDREIRRRVWTVLFCWDWYIDLLRSWMDGREMSTLLNRLMMIHSKYTQFPLPIGRLEQDQGTLAPTPTTNMILQCQLIQKIVRNHQDLSESILPLEQLSRLQQDVQEWFKELPLRSGRMIRIQNLTPITHTSCLTV